MLEENVLRHDAQFPDPVLARLSWLHNVAALSGPDEARAQRVQLRRQVRRLTRALRQLRRLAHLDALLQKHKQEKQCSGKLGGGGDVPRGVWHSNVSDEGSKMLPMKPR